MRKKQILGEKWTNAYKNTKMKSKNLSDLVITNFLEALTYSYMKNEERNLIDNIENCQPDLYMDFPDSKINMERLDKNTVQILIKYVKNKFKECSIQYA